MTSATSVTSERAQGFFSKITFLKSVHSSEKDELCPGFEVKIFTKSVHRGEVRGNEAIFAVVEKSCFAASQYNEVHFLAMMATLG